MLPRTNVSEPAVREGNRQFCSRTLGTPANRRSQEHLDRAVVEFAVLKWASSPSPAMRIVYAGQALWLRFSGRSTGRRGTPRQSRMRCWEKRLRSPFLLIRQRRKETDLKTWALMEGFN
eukprot:gene25348-biopygen6002